MSTEGKFDRVPEDELREYIDNSNQLPGENDEQWRLRVQRAEADLLAKHQDSPLPASVKDDPLSSIGSPPVQEPSGDQPE